MIPRLQGIIESSQYFLRKEYIYSRTAKFYSFFNRIFGHNGFVSKIFNQEYSVPISKTNLLILSITLLIIFRIVMFFIEKRKTVSKTNSLKLQMEKLEKDLASLKSTLETLKITKKDLSDKYLKDKEQYSKRLQELESEKKLFENIIQINISIEMLQQDLSYYTEQLQTHSSFQNQIKSINESLVSKNKILKQISSNKDIKISEAYDEIERINSQLAQEELNKKHTPLDNVIEEIADIKNEIKITERLLEAAREKYLEASCRIGF